jgi:aminopeptidase
MFTQIQLENYASVLLWGLETARGKKFKRGEVVCLRFHLPALRLAEILYARLMEMGVNPVQQMVATPDMEHSFYHHADDRQLDFVPAGEKEFFKTLNGNIFLYAPAAITHLADIDSKKIGQAAIARKPFRDILTKREASGDFNWTLCAFTTKALAIHARLSQKAYTQQIVKACMLDDPSPVAAWGEIYKNIWEIKTWLSSLNVEYFQIESENIDLKVTPGKNRKWLGLSGHNIPSFEVFLSPDWRGTNGVYFADQPSYRSGNYVQGVRLEFKKGVAVKVAAHKGADFTKKQLAMDSGANKLGEFSLTDRRFSRINTFMANTLFDENYGGTSGNCHVAVGSAYVDSYDGNPAELTKAKKKSLGFNDSALHWDLVNTENKRVVAHLNSGKHTVIYENGEFSY